MNWGPHPQCHTPRASEVCPPQAKRGCNSGESWGGGGLLTPVAWDAKGPLPNTGPSFKGLVVARDLSGSVGGRERQRVRGDKRRTEGARLREEGRKKDRGGKIESRKNPVRGKKVWCESVEETVEEEEAPVQVKRWGRRISG